MPSANAHAQPPITPPVGAPGFGSAADLVIHHATHRSLSHPSRKMANMRTNTARQGTKTGDPAATARRTRGKSKQENWKRPAQVAVIALELDLSGDPQVRRRLEKHWSAVF